MKIAVDFDGTVVTHEYPGIGKDVGAVPVLKRFVKDGHKIILNTMRSGVSLYAAIGWFASNEIPLYGINEDPDQKSWTESPKAYANIYIDDAALGVPLLYPVKGFLPGEDHVEARPYVDWVKVEELFYKEPLNSAPEPIITEETQ